MDRGVIRVMFEDREVDLLAIFPHCMEYKCGRYEYGDIVVAVGCDVLWQLSNTNVVA